MLKVATVSPNEPYREYKDVERVYSGSTEIDKILDKNGNVLFAVNKEVEGTPTLTYKGKEETNLKNYRIYGQTVDGESVGDKTENLFDISKATRDVGYTYNGDGDYVTSASNTITGFIAVDENTTYTIKNTGYPPYRVHYFDINKQWISRTNPLYDMETSPGMAVEFTTPNNSKYIIMQEKDTNRMNLSTIMLNEGSTPLPYEPYGYKVPVTVEGKNLAPWDKQWMLNADGQIYSDINAYASIIDTHNIDYIYLFGDANKLNSHLYRIGKSNIVPNLGNIVTRSTSTGGLVNVSDYNYCLVTCQLYETSTTRQDLLNEFMITAGDIVPTKFEPYHAPVTTPIYLPEPIKMVGDEAEYIDYAEQKQHRVRKNLLKNTATSRTINGVTFTVNSDGSVTCNGKCVNNVAVLYIKRPTTFYDETIQYTLTGCPVGGAYNSTYALEYTNSVNQSKPDVGNGVSFTPYRKEFYPNACIRIVIFVGYTCDNLTFYPMIRKADIEDDTYEPYIENTDLDVTLPALPVLPGTNTLTVGTEVQPSNVYLKGRIKEVL